MGLPKGKEPDGGMTSDELAAELLRKVERGHLSLTEANAMLREKHEAERKEIEIRETWYADTGERTLDIGPFDKQAWPPESHMNAEAGE
jgi:hypothetical protein